MGINKPNPALSSRYIRGIFILVLVCMGLVVHDVFSDHGFLALRREKREQQSLKKNISVLKQENDELRAHIAALESDPKAIEKLAREKMHLARPGETIYTVPDVAKESEDPPGAPAEVR